MGLGSMMVKPLTSIARITGRALIGLLSAIAPFMMTPAGLALLGTAGIGWLVYTLYGKDIEDFENKYKKLPDPNDELMKSIPKNNAFTKESFLHLLFPPRTRHAERYENTQL